jgi:hypothetical protein
LREVRIRLPPSIDPDEVARAVRALAAGDALNAGPPRTLRTIPDSVHWHLTRERGGGTLEVTFDPTLSEVRVSVHENRRGSWAGEAMEPFAASLERMWE